MLSTINICLNCKIEFETLNKQKRCCSRSCENYYRYDKTDFREKIKKQLNSVLSTSEFKARHIKKMQKRWSNPQNKIDLSNKMKEICKNTPGRSEKYAEIWRKTWTEQRTQIMEKRAEKWKDPNFLENQYRLSFKRKIFQLPSGKIVKLQGYEPKALTELLIKYGEDDILIGTEFGFIEYKDEDKIRRYFPDFYIKSKNLIIEVKSDWTYKLNKDICEKKKNACLEQGYFYEMIIL